MSMGDFQKMNKITPQMLGQQLAMFWQRFFKLILSLFFLGMVSVGGYFWYFNVYQADWSEAEKENFLRAQFSETDLKREVLNKVIREIELKKENFGREALGAKNIFKPF